ncbi:MAG: hypothetical protein LUE93_00810 [Bacteroides sp.]|nr:hypothetical protein [Bacteroides sp.]
MFSSCFSESPITDHSLVVEARGVMRIEIIEQGEVAPEDQLNTVRLLVFDETSGWPKLELNKFF